MTQEIYSTATKIHKNVTKACMELPLRTHTNLHIHSSDHTPHTRTSKHMVCLFLIEFLVTFSCVSRRIFGDVSSDPFQPSLGRFTFDDLRRNKTLWKLLQRNSMIVGIKFCFDIGLWKEILRVQILKNQAYIKFLHFKQLYFLTYFVIYIYKGIKLKRYRL